MSFKGDKYFIIIKLPHVVTSGVTLNDFLFRTNSFGISNIEQHDRKKKTTVCKYLFLTLKKKKKNKK